MKNLIGINYKIAEDLQFFMEAENINIDELNRQTSLSKATIYEILKGGRISKETIEKVYSYIYDSSYRINLTKAQIAKELNPLVLFHGSRNGLGILDSEGSRFNCDFGKGFYLGESYENALSFVHDSPSSSIYSFSLDTEGLKVTNFKCELEWMLAICYYRGYLKEYSESKIIREIIDKIEGSDIIIAPIADNRMFYIMSLFANGELSVDGALHALSASDLGMQYVIKTPKALDKLKFVERYYISSPERNECKEKMYQRALLIETKLKMARRDFRYGKYIEEVIV